LIEENCFIPEGISPNGDGLNEVFDISFLNAKNIVIYNRYGTEIFQYNNYKNEWDGTSKNGKLLPTGTYFYVITKPNDEMITGWVYLNR
jgi:gliding motility-associated-like protein